MVANLNKKLYKSILILIKVAPFIIGLGYFLNAVCSLSETAYVLFGYMIHTSVISWVLLYTISFVFQFCVLHRLPLYYIVINDAIIVIDNYIGIPLTGEGLIRLHTIIAFIFFIFILYYAYFKYCSPGVRKNK